MRGLGNELFVRREVKVREGTHTHVQPTTPHLWPRRSEPMKGEPHTKTGLGKALPGPRGGVGRKGSGRREGSRREKAGRGGQGPRVGLQGKSGGGR